MAPQRSGLIQKLCYWTIICYFIIVNASAWAIFTIVFEIHQSWIGNGGAVFISLATAIIVDKMIKAASSIED